MSVCTPFSQLAPFARHRGSFHGEDLTQAFCSICLVARRNRLRAFLKPKHPRPPSCNDSSHDVGWALAGANERSSREPQAVYILVLPSFCSVSEAPFCIVFEDSWAPVTGLLLRNLS